MSKDWMPKNRHAFALCARDANSYLSNPLHAARMGFVEDSPQKVWFETEFQPAYNVFNNAYMTWDSPASRTPVIIKEVADAEALFKPLFRQLYTGFLKNNPLVTDADLEAMRLPAHNILDNVPTPAPVPVTFPECTVDRTTIRRLRFDYHDAGSARKGKPAGIHGAEIKWVMAEEKPASIRELRYSDFDTHTPFTLDFDESERGRTVWFALRWENNRGEKGPFGEILSVVVP